MRLRTFGLLALTATAGLTGTSDALIRPKDADAPFVAANRAPRTHRATAFARAAQLSQLSKSGLPGFHAIWDRDTDVPLRVWGKGPLAVGAVASPAIAEAAARRFLAAHLAVLAPGAGAADFELVSNTLSRRGDVRSVGFQQRAGGLRVLGGAIGFAFKGDRLAMISSTALPDVAIPAPASLARRAAGRPDAAARAAAWLAADGFSVTAAPKARAAAKSQPELLVLPIVRPRTGAGVDVSYRVVEQVTVQSIRGPGLWQVWVDADDGAPVARRSELRYATGTVRFDVSERHPMGPRKALPSIFATHTLDGTASTSTVDGTLTWNGNGPASVATGLAGTYARITNEAGATATASLTLPAGQSVTWSMANNEQGDAQLTSFIYANLVKQFARTRLDPSLPWLGEQLPVHVNEDGTCNAYSTGDDIHFFRADAQCQNTGRMADVVYHEFGHSLHDHAIIPGVGQFDGALSEGVSDVLASLITNDHGMGRGFFFDNDALRDLNPPGREKKWPDDVTGEVHDDGEIIGGTLWDLRAALEAKLGATAGYEKMLDLFYAILQRATDIPSTYTEVLLADDDDGDLSNGTPNQCVINQVFGAHGLADPAIAGGLSAPVRDGFQISVAMPTSSGACPGPTIASAVVRWKVRGAGAPAAVALAPSGARYVGAIPTQPAGTVVQYQVQVTLSDGSSVAYPNNPADPLYEFYVGPVEVVRCFNFEAGFNGWTHGATPAARDEWEAGAPAGLGGDPKAAYAGTGVLGMDLRADGAYSSSVTTFAESPEIDLGGHTAVRLQYRRWLGVEDGFYDKARVLVNGAPVWSNFASPTDPQASGVNHVDKEWRFADVDLAQHAASGKLKLRFELESDAGLEFAGWTLDDVCVMSTAAPAPAPACGNGTVDAGEACDDGNATDGDGCSASCTEEPGGGDDDGAGGEEPGGCCSTGSRPAGALTLSGLVLGLALRRRRRRRR
jgi:cysteine-rich repeat protein